MRKSGILLHISALPNKHGIGTFGKEAYEFVDFLKMGGIKYWQVLPLGPTSYGDSPYQSFSAFAGNPYFIDYDILKEEGLLKYSEYRGLKTNNKRVDYEHIYNTKFDILEIAFSRFDIEKEEYKEFKKENSYWLDNYSLFMSIKRYFNNVAWSKWDKLYQNKDEKTINCFKKENNRQIEYWKFIQYEFYKQWKNLKKYANSNGILIIGDLPIYVAYDSSDVWSDPKNWLLDSENKPIKVAGCPPDAFSSLGQLWGNPIYNYNYMEKNEYSWWIERFKKSFEIYDVIRIDHFRGFESFYTIDYKAENAINGTWEKGPGMKLFSMIKKELGEVKVIAEDLGFLTEEVFELIKETGFPGMKVLEFAFSPNEDSIYLPHNYNENSVCYPATHDNPTIKEWLDNLRNDEKEFCYKYTHITKESEAVDRIISLALSSVAKLVVVQLTDYLNLGKEARFNTPSTLSTYNWSYRVDKRKLSKKLAKKIYELNRIYKRV